MNQIQKFNKDVRENKAMLEEVKKIGNDMAKIVAYANSKGYSFTLADVEASAKKGGELSEEKLDKVAGGTFIATGVGDAIAVG